MKESEGVMDNKIGELPFLEYSRLLSETGAQEYGSNITGTSKLSFDELVASGLSHEEIKAEYGEETAINVGIARDPDSPELDAKWFAWAETASEGYPEAVPLYRRTRGKQVAPTKELISIRLDSDILDYFRSSGRGWQTRVNDMLRRIVFDS